MKTIQIIFNFLLLASSVLLGFSAYASDSVPSNIQILGRGVVNSETGDTVLISCYQSKSTNDACATLRLIQVQKDSSPTWLGSPFQNSSNIRDTLKTWVDASISNELHLLSASKKVHAFTSQDGWNWSLSPTQLSDQNFKLLVSSLLYFAEYKSAVENTPVEGLEPLDLKAKGGKIVDVARVSYTVYFDHPSTCIKNKFVRSMKKKIVDRYLAIGGNKKDLLFKIDKKIYLGGKSCYLNVSSSNPYYGIEKFTFDPNSNSLPGFPYNYTEVGVNLKVAGFHDDPQLILTASFDGWWHDYFRWFKKPTQ